MTFFILLHLGYDMQQSSDLNPNQLTPSISKASNGLNDHDSSLHWFCALVSLFGVLDLEIGVTIRRPGALISLLLF